jgi:hypothetical protein
MGEPSAKAGLVRTIPSRQNVEKTATGWMLNHRFSSYIVVLMAVFYRSVAR